MKNLKTVFLLFFCISKGFSQNELWETKDKQKLIDNYKRAQKELNDETTALSKKQWNFRMGEGKWTIGQVVEHVNMWHLITQAQLRNAEFQGPKPELVSKTLPDSVVTKFIYEEKSHVSPDISIPTGLIPDDINRQLFNIKCDEIVQKLESSTIDLGQYFRTFPGGYQENFYQMHTIHYGHIDRHLRQIRRIKADSNFPK
ncbi:MAG: DinB family protein [Bacteroidota bacterium]